jgi:hypothetical protein
MSCCFFLRSSTVSQHGNGNKRANNPCMVTREWVETAVQAAREDRVGVNQKTAMRKSAIAAGTLDYSPCPK